MSDEEVKQQKEIALYSQQVQAWVNTRMELDKSILTLSAGAIGILMTLISVSDTISTITHILYIVSVFFLIVTIVFVLIVFHFNAKYLEDTISQNGKDKSSKSALDRLDLCIKVLFSFSIILSIITLSFNLNTKGCKMSEENNTNTTIVSLSDKMESLSGISKLAPKNSANTKSTKTNSSDANSTKDTTNKK